MSSATGEQVPLAQISDPAFRSAAPLIKRYNRERAVTVTAWPATGYATDELTRQVIAGLDAIAWPPGYRYVAAGEVEARSESFSGLGVAMLVAVFGILAVLVLEFGSFRSMLIVFGVVPLGITGALAALFLTGYTLSFTAMIGMIALVGIEIKNSILLVDFTNRLRASGMALDDAIAEAGEVRFLPILLTSLTAIGGLTAARPAGLGPLLPARDRDHRRAGQLDAARAPRDAGDVQAAAAGRGRAARSSSRPRGRGTTGVSGLAPEPAIARQPARASSALRIACSTTTGHSSAPRTARQPT